jgi:hypothetical protein
MASRDFRRSRKSRIFKKLHTDPLAFNPGSALESHVNHFKKCSPNRFCLDGGGEVARTMCTCVSKYKNGNIKNFLKRCHRL